MRGLVPYLLAGILVVLAMDVVAHTSGLGMALSARPVTEHGAITQFVDRTHKGDRLSWPTDVNTQQALPKAMVGCDPAYSPLLTSARASTAGRCIA
jgi:hypothetical protein